MDPTLPTPMAEWKRCVKVLEDQINLMYDCTLKKRLKYFLRVSTTVVLNQNDKLLRWSL